MKQGRFSAHWIVVATTAAFSIGCQGKPTEPVGQPDKEMPIEAPPPRADAPGAMSISLTPDQWDAATKGVKWRDDPLSARFQALAYKPTPDSIYVIGFCNPSAGQICKFENGHCMCRSVGGSAGGVTITIKDPPPACALNATFAGGKTNSVGRNTMAGIFRCASNSCRGICSLVGNRIGKLSTLACECQRR